MDYYIQLRSMMVEITVIRFDSKIKTKKLGRKLMKLSVTISNTAHEFGGNENVYSEIKEVEVDPKIRTLSFAEDLRPAYV